MIKAIETHNPAYKADNRTTDQNGEYKDPLMKWPLRGAAFTNEVGEAMRPIIGSYANLTWVPVLTYIGADVYDKYKNDQTEYSPSSRRALKQSIFQGLASVFLPILAVKAGQNIFSQAGKFMEEKISLNAIEHVSKTAEQFIANGKMRAFNGKDEECIQEFLSQVSDSLDFTTNKKSLRNKLKLFPFSKKENVQEYAKTTIQDLIKLRKELLTPTDTTSKTKWFAKYEKALAEGKTKSVAVKTVLTEFQKSKLLKGNFIKTIGGFGALAIAIKPIDYFVENILIDKYLGPKIDNFQPKNRG